MEPSPPGATSSPPQAASVVARARAATRRAVVVRRGCSSARTGSARSRLDRSKCTSTAGSSSRALARRDGGGASQGVCPSREEARAYGNAADRMRSGCSPGARPVLARCARTARAVRAHVPHAEARSPRSSSAEGFSACGAPMPRASGRGVSRGASALARADADAADAAGEHAGAVVVGLADVAAVVRGARGRPLDADRARAVVAGGAGVDAVPAGAAHADRAEAAVLLAALAALVGRAVVVHEALDRGAASAAGWPTSPLTW